nr:hypothetical protein [Tanacetum cinerariifolium]
MVDLTFVDQHNMVACLERTDRNAAFHQIVDFLITSPIYYALTVSPAIYASYIEQFWATAKSKTVNDVKQIPATVDGKTVIISESSVMSDLHFNDEDIDLAEPFNDIYVTPVHTKKLRVKVQDNPLNPNHHLQLLHPLIKNKLLLLHHNPKRPTHLGEDDRVVRAVTTTTSLVAEHESGNINKTQSTATLNEPSPQGTGSSGRPRYQDTTLGDADAQIREDSMEHQDDLTNFVPPTPHDSSLSEGHTPGSDEDLVIKKLQKKVKRLEKKQRARTLGMNLFKIGTSKRQSLDKENVSKQERNLKTRPMFKEGDIDNDFDDINDMVDEAIENVKGDTVNAGGAVNTATTGVSTASASVTTAGVSISTAEPRTPPTTTTTTINYKEGVMMKLKNSFTKHINSSKQAGSRKTRAGLKLKPKSPKKLKVMKEQESAVDEQEKEELRLCLKIV